MKQIPLLTSVLTAEQDQTESPNSCPVAQITVSHNVELEDQEDSHIKRCHALKTGRFQELDRSECD